MANFCRGDSKLGKALPRHKLMQHLLLSDLGAKKIVKITTGTQTDFRKPTATCCCQRGQPSPDFLKRQSNENYQSLLASIRERVIRVDEESCCSCSDTWSDGSTGDTDVICFPKETRTAVSVVLNQCRRPQKPRQNNPTTVSRGAWPGVAERMDHDGEKRLINADRKDNAGTF